MSHSKNHIKSDILGQFMQRFINLHHGTYQGLYLILLWILTLNCALAQTHTTLVEKKTNGLELINQSFHQAIQASFEKQKSQQPPLIVYEHRKLKLLKNGQITQDLSIEPPQLYHQLKAISHLPLLIYLDIVFNRNFEKVKQIQTQIQIAETDLNTLSWDAEKTVFPLDQITKKPEFQQEMVLKDQQKVLKESAIFLSLIELQPKVLLEDQKALLEKIFKDYFEQVKTEVFHNISYCAYLHLSVIHTQAMILYQSLSVSEKEQVQAIGYGPKGPRADSLGVQYLSWLIKQKGENERVIYFEGKTDLEQVLKALAKFNVELEIGEDLYGDALFMQRDILGADAYQILKKAIHTP
jgi:hypothetical protein